MFLPSCEIGKVAALAKVYNIDFNTLDKSSVRIVFTLNANLSNLSSVIQELAEKWNFKNSNYTSKRH